MNKAAPTDSSQLQAVITSTTGTDPDGTFRCVLSVPAAVADQGRIVLGGGFRLPMKREVA
jgi:hypothetical protein